MTRSPPIDERVAPLLGAWRRGDAAARGALFELLYRDLHAVAQRQMSRERSDTLAPTSLVHEAFLRLDLARLDCEDRAAFLRLAAAVMRHILVDAARRRSARRRALDAAHRARAPARDDDARAIALETALEHLAACDVHLMRVVELRFLLGMSVAECASELRVSEATVKRHWRTARAFLQRELEQRDRPPT